MASVVIIHPFDAIAGSQRVAVTVAQALRSDGYQAELRLGFGTNGFVSQWPGVKRFLGVDNIRVRKLLYPLWLVTVTPRVLRAVVAGEIVWANTIHAAPAALVGLVLSPRRVVIHVHEVEFPRVFMSFLQLAKRRGATLLCVSDYHRRALRLDAEVLPNCVPMPVDDCALARRSRLVFVGNTSVMKGFALFVEVARRLCGSELTPVAFLASREQCDPSLLLQAKSAGIAVKFGVTAPEEMFDAGYLSLLCTDPGLWTETFSLVAVESMGCLVPVASAWAGVAQEILGPALAFEVPSRDPETIVQEIRALLSQPERYARLVQACRARRNEYSFERFQLRVRALVSRLADGPPR